MRMKIGIVILNYNNNIDTLNCLDSISEHINNENIIVFLIDNNSEKPLDESFIKKYQIRINYTINHENLGFAEGNNVGIRQALKNECDYIVLLNNDTVLIDNSLSELINLINADEEIGVGGLVNYYFNNQDKIWQAGFFNNFKKGKTKAIQNFNLLKKELIYADYVPGSSFVIKKTVIQKIGMLDSNYFAYYEENDFCTRAAEAGYKIAFLSSSKILHKVGVSSNSITKFYLRTRNELVFYKKFSSRFYFTLIFTKLYINKFAKIATLKLKLNQSFRFYRALNLAFNDFIKGNLFDGNLNKL